MFAARACFFVRQSDAVETRRVYRIIWLEEPLLLRADPAGSKDSSDAVIVQLSGIDAPTALPPQLDSGGAGGEFGFALIA